MAGLMRDASPGRLVHGSPGLDQGQAPSFSSLLSSSLRACLRSRQAVAAFAVAAVLALAALSQVADVGYTRGTPPVADPVPSGSGGEASGKLPTEGNGRGVSEDAKPSEGGGEGKNPVETEAAKDEASGKSELTAGSEGPAKSEVPEKSEDPAKGEGPVESEVAAKSEGGASSEEGEEGPDPLRPSKCPEGCAANGICNEETGECHCVPSQEGPACASTALPRCQLAPGYSSPCYMRYHLSTCECTQDCQKFRLPVGSHCVRGTQSDGSLNPNLTEIYEGKQYWVHWHSHGTGLAVPDYGVEGGEEQRERLFVSPLECPESCSGRGVCNRFKACECPWLVGGPTCQETFRHSALARGPESACLNACSGRGRCEFGTCRCDKGFFGIDCSLYIGRAGKTRLVRLPPYKWASLPVRDAPRLRPRVYVYDLPGYFNTWQGVHSGALDWEEPVWFLERLLNSPFRTANPDEADFFYIPLFIRARNNNEANVVAFAKEYIRKRWPHFDSSGGANHIVLTNSDWANCALGGPGGHGAMSAVLDDLMTLTLWGMSKNMTYGDDHPCFRPGRDIVIPPIMDPEVYRQAPNILSDEAGEPEDRPILCYFRGSSYVDAIEIPGQYVMSLGVRQAMFGNFSGTFNKTGILLEGMRDPAPEPHWYLKQMRRARFCLAAAGYGWAMRTTQAVIMGCIPLVIMPDVYQPFEGDGLKWDEFSVRVRYEDIPNLEAILRSYSAEQVQGLQRGMRAVRRRFMWSSTSLNPFSGEGFTPEDVEKGAQQLEGMDAFVTVMDALRLRLNL